MATPMRPADQDYERLSAYLDGELLDSARAAFEARLAAEPALRAALDDMHATVQILRAAPAIKPPRNFTLDPARYQRRTPWWARAGALQLTGAVGTLASILLIAFGVLFSAGGVGAPQSNARNIAALATATPHMLAGITGGRTEEQQATNARHDESIASNTESNTAQPYAVTTTVKVAGTVALADSLTVAARATAASALVTATPAPTMTFRRASIPPTPTTLPTALPTAAALAVPTRPAAAVMPAPPGVSPDKGVNGPMQPTAPELSGGAPVESPQTGEVGGSSAQAVQVSATATGVGAGYAPALVPPTATLLSTATVPGTASPPPAAATNETFAGKSAIAETPTVTATAAMVKPESLTNTATVSPMPASTTTRSDLDVIQRRSNTASLALIVGSALFVFSVVLLGIGFLRSRL